MIQLALTQAARREPPQPTTRTSRDHLPCLTLTPGRLEGHPTQEDRVGNRERARLVGGAAARQRRAARPNQTQGPLSKGESCTFRTFPPPNLPHLSRSHQNYPASAPPILYLLEPIKLTADHVRKLQRALDDKAKSLVGGPAFIFDVSTHGQWRRHQISPSLAPSTPLTIS